MRPSRARQRRAGRCAHAPVGGRPRERQGCGGGVALAIFHRGSARGGSIDQLDDLLLVCHHDVTRAD